MRVLLSSQQRPSSGAALFRPVLALSVLTMLCALVSMTPAVAQEAKPSSPAPRAQFLAANCANCHGTDGRSAPGSSVPGLAGTSEKDFLASMKAFQTGERPATLMHQIAKGYTDEQLQLLASYFARQPKP